MRDLFLGVAIPAALIWALFSAPGSILVLNWIWFQRPYDFSYGTWASLPLFKVALGVAVISNLLHGQLRPKFTPLLWIYLVFLVWITISTFFAYDAEIAWETYWAYLPSMWVAPILLFATIHDLKMLRMVLWVSAGGIAFNAFKVGAVLTAEGGGHVTNQISGFVGDNNVFGLVLCLVVAMLMGLRTTLPAKTWVRGLFYVFITFVLLTIIYTQSRGAFAAMGVILLMGSILSNRPFRNTFIFIAFVVAGYMAIPAENFERLTTVSNLSEDVSAEGRFQNWSLAWQEALEHPLVGVGLENHIPYNTEVVQPAVQVRVAHSVYFQILGELGFPALILFLIFILMGLWSLVRTWRHMIPVAEKHPDLVWVRNTAFWMVCGYVGYSLGAGLLNMLYIEFPWYAIFYGSMLLPLVEQELQKRERIPSEATVRNELEFN
jgi:probable O-glycosylation ligase (exosortase A-associated)